jgi:hypothetical protein
MNSYFKMNRDYRIAWLKHKDSKLRASPTKRVEKEFPMDGEHIEHH